MQIYYYIVQNVVSTVQLIKHRSKFLSLFSNFLIKTLPEIRITHPSSKSFLLCLSPQHQLSLYPFSHILETKAINTNHNHIISILPKILFSCFLYCSIIRSIGRLASSTITGTVLNFSLLLINHFSWASCNCCKYSSGTVSSSGRPLAFILSYTTSGEVLRYTEMKT